MARKYDPRLDRLAYRFVRDGQHQEGWSFRAQEADSWGPGHLIVWWSTGDMTAAPAELEIKRSVRGTRIVRQDASGAKLSYLLPEPFDSIVARLEQRIRESGAPATLEELIAFLGLVPQEEPCRTLTM